MLETAIEQLVTAPTDNPNEIWVEALPARIYKTPQYGDVIVTPDKLERMIRNFHTNIRGQDIATDFDHGMDRSKGNKASGWYRDFELRPSTVDPNQMSLFAKIEVTNEAANEIQDNQWKYFSLEWDDAWQDTDGNTHEDVIMGGGFTNRPIVKHTLPINFSESMWEELDDDTKREFAVWSTKFVNTLPDSAFLYIEPGGKKDGEGKTVPRDKRHFPFKGPSGGVDLPHLRNAIARIPQSGPWLSESLKNSLQARARRLLAAHGKAMSEGEAAVGLFNEALAIMDESKEWEHSEPGTGSPPQPRTDQDGSDEPDRKGGWRRETPPIAEDPPQNSANNTANVTYTFTKPEGGNGVYEFSDKNAHELLRILELPVDADDDKVLESVKLKFGELSELRNAVDTVTQEKIFAEQYPQYWAEHNKLMERDRNNSAKAFSESVQQIRKTEGYGLKSTKQALSVQALEKVQEVHRKFSEGKATLEDFEEVVKTIVNGGIIQFGEVGTSHDDDSIPEYDTNTANGVAGARKAFAEVVSKIQKEHEDWDYMQCVNEASKKYPDLAESYKIALPA